MRLRLRPAHVLLLASTALLALATPALAQVVRAFTPRYSVNQPGDITLIANTLMTCSGGGSCTNGQNGTGGNVNNNDFTMVYVDVDGDATTFNSSSATLTLPAGTSVLWAGLYWSGWSANAARGTVKLQTPITGYATLTATQVDVSASQYQGFVDVTAQVRAAGNGSYRVANVQSSPNNSNVMAGWSIVVVYGDPTQSPRNLVVFDGFASVAPGNSVAFTVNGFVTPPAGNVNTRVGCVAYEGDLGYTGDSFLLGGAAVGDARNPTTNFFNSSISLLGNTFTAKNPNYLNQLGFDADIVTANGLLPNNATAATITLTSTNDQFYPGVVTFATDLYAPVFDAANLTKTATDLNGGLYNPGDVIEYTVTMKNNGQDNAIACVLRDTLSANVTYVPSSLQVSSGSNAGAKTDAAGDDVMEYVAASRSIVARLGSGANSTTGGQIDIAAATSIKFRVSVNAAQPTGTLVSNQAWLQFTGKQSGVNFAAPSDGDPITPGAQPTVISLTAVVNLGGTVYADADHDGQRGASEAGTGVTLYAKLVANAASSASQVVAVNTSTGAYQFTGVSSGTYSILLDTSNDPARVVPTIPPGWLGTQSASGVRSGVNVLSADIPNLDFGLWHGSRIDGTVFRDDGGAIGTGANDGALSSGESGVSNIRVRLTSGGCAGSSCDSALTDAAGRFSLWLPFAGAGANVKVTQVRPSGWLATGGGAGTTGGAYARTTDDMTFTAASGVAYGSLAFGDVPMNTWAPPGARVVAAGSVAAYAHRFTAGSAGSVRFRVQQTPNPAVAGWSVQLVRDLDCSGTADAGEPVITPGALLALTAGQSMCVVARHQSPAAAPNGASEQASLTASFVYTGASPALTDSSSLGDATTVSATSGLVIQKSVDLGTAKPGDYLVYTISYSNPGSAALSSIVIRDATPPWTVFDSATCATLGPGLSGCAVSQQPAAGASGAVTWTLIGSLAPGGAGSVSYRVRVQ